MRADQTHTEGVTTLNPYQGRADVNSAKPKFTCQHRFSDGHVATFKLYRGESFIEWEPPLPADPPYELMAEYYRWYEVVLGRVVEDSQKGSQVLESVIVTINNFIIGWRVLFADGLRIEVAAPEELCYVTWARKNGEDVTSTLNLEWVGQFVQAFVFRIPTR